MATVSQLQACRAMSEFSKALDRAITSGKTTVTKLADITGLSRMHIYRLRRGEQAPSLVTAEAICKEIGATITISAAK